jgi:hypothetical protein
VAHLDHGIDIKPLDAKYKGFLKDDPPVRLGLETPVLSEGPDDAETVFVKLDSDVVLLLYTGLYHGLHCPRASS